LSESGIGWKIYLELGDIDNRRKPLKLSGSKTCSIYEKDALLNWKMTENHGLHEGLLRNLHYQTGSKSHYVEVAL
jgi:hypothetical protein